MLASSQPAIPPSTRVYREPARNGWLLRSATAAGAALLVGSLASSLFARRRPGSASERLRHGAALLSFSVLADSALEHYRAQFKNSAMYVAPTVAASALSASMDTSSQRRGARKAAFASALLTGLAGSAFHVYNVLKRPGGIVKQSGRINWSNLMYGAPIAAPMALSMAGALGLASQRRPGLRSLAAGIGIGLLGTSAEVALLHFRGAYQNPFMYVPLVVPPAAAIALLAHALAPSSTTAKTGALLLRATAATGFAGVGFHAYGIQRNMGGFANWSQMLLQGPPLPAPPSFTGLALAGLAALEPAR
jgi:hypothetical protein